MVKERNALDLIHLGVVRLSFHFNELDLIRDQIKQHQAFYTGSIYQKPHYAIVS